MIQFSSMKKTLVDTNSVRREASQSIHVHRQQSGSRIKWIEYCFYDNHAGHKTGYGLPEALSGKEDRSSLNLPAPNSSLGFSICMRAVVSVPIQTSSGRNDDGAFSITSKDPRDTPWKIFKIQVVCLSAWVVIHWLLFLGDLDES